MEPLLESVAQVAAQDADQRRGGAQHLSKVTSWTVIAAGLLSLAVGLLVAWLVSRGIVKSIGDCLGFAQRIARGDLSGRMPAPSGAEFATLAEALNEMSGALEQRNRELEGGIAARR